MTDDVLHGDDPAREGNLSAEEYNRELAEYAKAHPKSEIPADQYRMYEDYE